MIEPNLTAQVTRRIADVLGAWSRPIEPDALLRDDLGADSLHLQSIAAELDVAFDIEIPDDDLALWLTPADVVRTVARMRTTQESTA